MLNDGRKIGKRSISNEHNFNFVNGQLGDNMKARKIGNVWKVWFLDCSDNIQTAEHKNLQLALSMAFINRTTTLGE